jgi:hypothetical protein
MGTNLDIGKIKSAISEGRQAYSDIDFGPSIPPEIANKDDASADWGVQFINPNIFVAGVHKWGSTTLRVTK